MEKTLKKANKLYESGIYARSLELYEKVIKARFIKYPKDLVVLNPKILKKKIEVCWGFHWMNKIPSISIELTLKTIYG